MHVKQISDKQLRTIIDAINIMLLALHGASVKCQRKNYLIYSHTYLQISDASDKNGQILQK